MPGILPELSLSDTVSGCKDSLGDIKITRTRNNNNNNNNNIY